MSANDIGAIKSLHAGYGVLMQALAHDAQRDQIEWKTMPMKYHNVSSPFGEFGPAVQCAAARRPAVPRRRCMHDLRKCYGNVVLFRDGSMI